MANNYEDMPVEDIGEVTVTLELDDGTVAECVVLAIYPASNGKSYVALLPLEPEEGAEDEVYIYRHIVTADNEDDIENIESDEEYEIAADAFDELLDTWEFEDMDDEDEETK